MSNDLSVILPRVLIVSRRSLRKNKFVDFVGTHFLDFFFIHICCIMCYFYVFDQNLALKIMQEYKYSMSVVVMR